MKTKIEFNLDQVVKDYNERNPNLRQIDGKQLAKIIGVTPQTFVVWKSGKIPSAISNIVSILEFTGSKFEDLIKKTDEKN